MNPDKTAEGSEEQHMKPIPKCVATVNVFGYPMPKGCISLPDIHDPVVTKAVCLSDVSACLHHVPVYAAITPDEDQPMGLPVVHLPPCDTATRRYEDGYKLCGAELLPGFDAHDYYTGLICEMPKGHDGAHYDESAMGRVAWVLDEETVAHDAAWNRRPSIGEKGKE